MIGVHYLSSYKTIKYSLQIELLKEVLKKNATLLLEKIENLPFEHLTEITNRPAPKELFLKKPLNSNEIDSKPKLKQKHK